MKLTDQTGDLRGGGRGTIPHPFSRRCGKGCCWFYRGRCREVFFVMCLNTKNRVVAVHRCHIGSINASIVHPREVFKSAILNNSAAIILCHQYPSQDTNPSREDIEVTKRLVEAGRMMGIGVLDHLVVNAKAGYTSLKEKGYV